MSAPNTPWNGTPEGQSLNAVFDGLRDTYQTQVIKHIDTLSALAVHQLKGT